MQPNLIKISKFLSLVLRHQPDKIGLVLDANGWAEVDDLIQRSNKYGIDLSHELLKQVVAENDKQRFAISDDGRLIRANQGHSFELDLALVPTEPPECLFHGTATRFIESIRRSGLHSAKRQHVHLSADETTATKVGLRHGKPAILKVRSGKMSQDGYSFFISDNGVWLTDSVPQQYIEFPSSTS